MTGTAGGMTGAAGGDGRTLMWEAKAAPERGEDLLAWVLEAVGDGQVFRSADRVVLVVDLPGDRAPTDTPDEVVDVLSGVPTELLARTPHAWRFRRVR